MLTFNESLKTIWKNKELVHTVKKLDTVVWTNTGKSGSTWNTGHFPYVTFLDSGTETTTTALSTGLLPVFPTTTISGAQWYTQPNGQGTVVTSSNIFTKPEYSLYAYPEEEEIIIWPNGVYYVPCDPRFDLKDQDVILIGFQSEDGTWEFMRNATDDANGRPGSEQGVAVNADNQVVDYYPYLEFTIYVTGDGYYYLYSEPYSSYLCQKGNTNTLLGWTADRESSDGKTSWFFDVDETATRCSSKYSETQSTKRWLRCYSGTDWRLGVSTVTGVNITVFKKVREYIFRETAEVSLWNEAWSEEFCLMANVGDYESYAVMDSGSTQIPPPCTIAYADGFYGGILYGNQLGTNHCFFMCGHSNCRDYGWSGYPDGVHQETSSPFLLYSGGGFVYGNQGSSFTTVSDPTTYTGYGFHIASMAGDYGTIYFLVPGYWSDSGYAFYYDSTTGNVRATDLTTILSTDNYALLCVGWWNGQDSETCFGPPSLNCDDIHMETIYEVFSFAEIAALDNGVTFQYYGDEAVVVYQKGNYTFLKDLTGFCLIYGSVGSLSQGTAVISFQGRTSLYNGVREIINPAEFEIDLDTIIEVYPDEQIIDEILNLETGYFIFKSITCEGPVSEDGYDWWYFGEVDGSPVFKVRGDCINISFENGKMYDLEIIFCSGYIYNTTLPIIITPNGTFCFIISATEVTDVE